MRLSKSAVITYENCPYNFKLDYILGFRKTRPDPEEGSPLLVGSQIHEIFENYYKLPEAAAVRGPFYEENIFDILMTIKNAKKYENHMENFASFNAAQIEGYEQKGLRIIPKGVPGYIPKYVEMKVFNKETNTLGYIDRVDMEEKGARIIDYKSSKRSRPVKHYLFELSLYAYTFEQETGIKVHDAGIYFSNEGKLRATPITEDDKLGAIKKVFDAREAIKQKIFPKTPSFFCNWCENSKICGESEDF